MGHKWLVRASVMAPAVLSAVALVLPWWFSSRVVHVIHGATVTRVDGTFLSGFTVLELYKVVLILVTGACAFVAVLFSRAGGFWLGAVHGATVTLVAIAAFAAEGAALGSVVLALTGVFLLARVSFEIDKRGFALFAVFVFFAVAIVTKGSPAESAGAEPANDSLADLAAVGSTLVAAGEFDASTRLLPVNGAVAVLDHGELKRAEDGDWITVVRVDDPEVTVLGIVRDLLVYYRADTFEVRVAPLRGGEHAVLTGVVGVDSMTPEGTLLLRTAGVRIPTLRRLDVTKASGRSEADSHDVARVPGIRSLLETDDPKQPMLFHEQPDSGEIVALDNTELNRAVLVGARPGARRWEPLTGGGGHKDCMGSVRAASLISVDALTPDDSDGWWLHDSTEMRTHSLLNVGADGYLRDLAEIPHEVVPHALMTGTDGALYLLADDGLWRIREPGALLAPATRAPECVPHPFVADPVRLEPADTAFTNVVPDGSGGTWTLDLGVLEHRNPRGELVDSQPASTKGDEVAVDLSGGVPFVGLCPPARSEGGPVAPVPVSNPDGCWDAIVTGRDGRGWAVVDGLLYSFGPAGVVQVTHGPVRPSPDDAVAIRLARGEAPDAVPLHKASLALDRDGRPLILTDDVLLGGTDQGALVVLGQDDRLWSMTLITTEDGPAVRTADATTHRLGY